MVFRWLVSGILSVVFVGTLRADDSPWPTLWPIPKVVSTSDVIAVGRITNQSKPAAKAKTTDVELELTEIVRGNIKPGKITAKMPADSSRAAPDGDILICLDKDMNLRFVGHPPKDGKIAADPLYLQALYNRDVKEDHRVVPTLITLDQLRIFLKEMKLQYRFRGPLYFPRSSGGWEPSKFVIEGTYDGLKPNNGAVISGLPDVKGFLWSVPHLSMWYYPVPNLTLVYNPAKPRPLSILGHLQEVDQKTGEWLMKFIVSEPNLLSVADFEAYIADERKQKTLYRLKLTCPASKDDSKPRVLTLTIPKRTEARLDGWDKRALQATVVYFKEEGKQSFSTSVPESFSRWFEDRWHLVKNPAIAFFFRLGKDELLVFQFDIDPTKRDMMLRSSTVDLFFDLASAGSLKGTIFLCSDQAGKEVTTFNATFDGMSFEQDKGN